MSTDLSQWNENDRMAAAAVHGGVIFGFAVIAPIIIWAISKDKNPALAEYAKKALIVQLVAGGVVMIISLVTCGIGAFLLLPWFGYELYLTIMAIQGKVSGYPF